MVAKTFSHYGSRLERISLFVFFPLVMTLIYILFINRKQINSLKVIYENVM